MSGGTAPMNQLSTALDRLRPHPHRGDLVAAGAVPLALAAVTIELRMTQWSLAARFLVVALIAGLLLTLAWLSELEGPAPRAYHSTLFVTALLPLAVAIVLLSELLGAHRPPGAGAITWSMATEAGVAAAAARRARSGVCTLIAALAGVIALEALVAWVFHPHGIGTFRAILLLSTLLCAGGAVCLRDAYRGHAVALVNAGGAVTIVLAFTLLITTLLGAALSRLGAGTLPVTAAGSSFGWKLYILAVGFGLLAYAGVDNERGPAYIGVAVLMAFALLVGAAVGRRGSLVGWPLLLLVLGAAGIALGLRPRTPLPPSPATRSGAAASTVPLRPEESP